ncbi:MAG: DNA-binding response regulator [Bacteroidetes bacterium]|nr:MAG: DNA-binding response regulator [Bacteroidota bacterium]
MDNLKVLVVEDDPNLGTILTEYLEAKGYDPTLCVDGQKGYDEFVKGQYQFCILDIMMPIKDGFTLAREIRKTDKVVPILFLTAKSLKEDTIEGFAVGADDYLTKPFSMEELLVRMKAILRRTRAQSTRKAGKKQHIIGSFKFDELHQTLLIGKKSTKLTSKESDLLGLLCNTGAETLEREYALKSIWGDDSYFNARSMDVYIAKLRKYLKADPSVEIVNVHGRGFKLIGVRS